MKNKSFFINIIFFVAVFLFFSQPALALEINYPVLPGGTSITPSTSIEGYIAYIFELAIILSGMVGILSIAIAGIKILLSGGNPSVASEAKAKIFDSVLGIILLMFSVILLGSINPELVTVKDSYASIGAGVYLGGASASVDLKSAPGAISDTTDSTVFDPQYNRIVYACTPPGKTILVDTFGQTNFGVDGSAQTITIPCGSEGANISSTAGPSRSDGTSQTDSGSGISTSTTKSFDWRYEDVGVYYYLNPGCTGLASNAQRSKGQIPLFGGESILNMQGQTIKSVKIVSGTDAYKRFGVVLNKNSDGSGECSAPLLNPFAGSKCFDLYAEKITDLDGKPFNPLYGYILNLYPETSNNDQDVTLYSSDFFVKLNAKQIGTQYSIYPGYIGDFGYNGTPDEFLRPPCYPSDDPTCPAKGGGFGQVFTGTYPPYECTPADPHQSCLNNVKPSGSFYTIIYAKNDIDANRDGILEYSDRTCKVFGNGVGGLNDNSLLESKRKPYRLDIIPKI